MYFLKKKIENICIYIIEAKKKKRKIEYIYVERVLCPLLPLSQLSTKHENILFSPYSIHNNLPNILMHEMNYFIPGKRGKKNNRRKNLLLRDILNEYSFYQKEKKNISLYEKKG